jgi:pilus assembly protein TadC
MLILAAICSGNLLLRGSFEDPHQRARIGAIVALLAILDVPLIVLATRIFRGIHPVHPSMSTTMRAVLVASVVGFAALFLLITEWRRRQIMLGNSITDMENREYNC